MASKLYLHDINLSKNELLNAKLHPIYTADRVALGSTLNSADESLLVYDIQIDAFYVWDGNQWVRVGVTDEQLDWLVDAHQKTIRGIHVFQTQTERTIELVHEDNTTTSDSYAYAYIHVQPTPSTIWTILHNLGKYPSVSVVDDAEQEVICEVEYNNADFITLRFSAPFRGKAYIN